MKKVLQLIQEIVNMYIRIEQLKCAYLEKPLNNLEKSDSLSLHLYLILNNKMDENDIINVVKGLSYICYKEMNNDKNILHLVTDNHMNLFFHSVNKIYDFKELKMLYNPFDLKICTNDEEIMNEVNSNLFKSINDFTNELNNLCYYIYDNNLILAFNSLTIINYYVMIFLANYYLHTPYSKNDYFNVNMDKVKDLMNKDDLRRYQKLMTMLRTDCVVECSKLFIWFVDDYIANLPILVAQNIDIDYYLYVKNNILKLKKNGE